MREVHVGEPILVEVGKCGDVGSLGSESRQDGGCGGVLKAPQKRPGAVLTGITRDTRTRITYKLYTAASPVGDSITKTRVERLRC